MMFSTMAKRVTLFGGVLFLLLMPFIVSAQNDSELSDRDKELKARLDEVTTLPNQSDLVVTDEAGVVFQGVTRQCWVAGTCSICDMLVVVVNIMNGILRVFAIIGVLMLLYGAAFLTLSSGNTERVTRGKAIMRAAIIGGVIVLGSWQFMNILVTTLYNTSLESESKSTVTYNPVTSWYTVVTYCRENISGK